MHRIRITQAALAVATALAAGCSTSAGPAVATRTTSTPRPTTAATPKATPAAPATPGGFVETKVAANNGVERTTNALHVAAVSPLKGLDLRYLLTTDAQGASTVTLHYLPDPPDAAITLDVPDSSLGGSVVAAHVAFTAGGSTLTVAPLTLPIAPVHLTPGDTKIITVPIGTSLLRPLFAAGAPTSLTATVTFDNEQGFPVVDPTLKPLSAMVPFTLAPGG